MLGDHLLATRSEDGTIYLPVRALCESHGLDRAAQVRRIKRSEYSELVDRRTLTCDEQQDFVVRRTVDGYLEIIEIKTPLKGRALFRYDRSHNTYS